MSQDKVALTMWDSYCATGLKYLLTLYIKGLMDHRFLSFPSCFYPHLHPIQEAKANFFPESLLR